MPLTKDVLVRLIRVAPPGVSFSTDPNGLCVASAWCPKEGRVMRWSERWSWEEVAEELADWTPAAKGER